MPAPEKSGSAAMEDEWTIGGWLDSLRLSSVIQAALRPAHQASGTDFEHIRTLSYSQLRTRLRAAKLEGLVDHLWSAVQSLKLQEAATARELNAKFASDAKFEMSFGSLESFFGGLEALIGPPTLVNGSVMNSMELEHNGDDANTDFTSSNGVTSTSSLEWQFVANPSEDMIFPDRAGLSAWRERASSKAHPDNELEPRENERRGRRPVMLTELTERMTAHNEQLEAEGHTKLVLDEVIGARLYTGPMYHKYNLSLRSRNPRAVSFVRDAFERDCQGNLYATTIHAINSCVLKSSKLQRACKVYRGFAGARLPTEFWVQNAHGVAGGVEFGFSSTTVRREEAVAYASGAASTVFEMQMGMVNRGADVSWLSQYEHEREILFTPLLGIEVLNTAVDGRTLIVHVGLSLNLVAATLEQVLNRRHKLLSDMAKGMRLEVRTALSGSDFEHPAEQALGVLQRTGPLSHPARWYNESDSHFQETVLGLMKAKAAVMTPNTRPAVLLEHAGPTVLSDRAGALLRLLAHPARAADRGFAVTALRAFDESGLAEHVEALLALVVPPPPLDATRTSVQATAFAAAQQGVLRAVLEVVALLPPAAVVPHAPKLLKLLSRESVASVQQAVLRALARFDATHLAGHVDALRHVLGLASGRVRASVLRVLLRAGASADTLRRELTELGGPTSEELLTLGVRVEWQQAASFAAQGIGLGDTLGIDVCSEPLTLHSAAGATSTRVDAFVLPAAVIGPSVADGGMGGDGSSGGAALALKTSMETMVDARSVACEGDCVAVGLHDGQILIFSQASGERVGVLQGHASFVMGLAMRDRVLWSGSEDGLVRRWDVAALECTHTLTEHAGAVLSLDLAEDALVSASKDWTVKVWPLDGSPSRATIPHADGVIGVTAHGDLAASGCDDSKARVFSVVSGHVTHTIAGHTRTVIAVALRGLLLATGSLDETVKLWSLAGAQAEAVATLSGHTGRIIGLAVLPGGLVASHATDHRLILWRPYVVRESEGEGWSPMETRRRDHVTTHGSG